MGLILANDFGTLLLTFYVKDDVNRNSKVLRKIIYGIHLHTFLTPLSVLKKTILILKGDAGADVAGVRAGFD